jgi:ankyrin repeat protein
LESCTQGFPACKTASTMNSYVKNRLLASVFDDCPLERKRISLLHDCHTAGALDFFVATVVFKVDEPNWQGRTLLHKAVMQGEQDVVRLLLDRFRANVNARDWRGCTPLHTATEDAVREDVVRLLLAHREIDVNARSSSGDNALHHIIKKSADSRLEGLAQLLCDKGASASEPDHDSCTPLHTAAAQGRLELVRVLVASEVKRVRTRPDARSRVSAFLAAKTSAGKTALDLARDHKRQDIERPLIDHVSEYSNVPVAEVEVRDYHQAASPFAVVATEDAVFADCAG